MTHDARSLTGRVLKGRYRLTRLIARGGMGEVYEAVDELAPWSRLAIKVVHPLYTDDEDLDLLKKRMHREAEVAQRIDSPYVARVLQLGVNRERRAWIAFEFLDGESLDVRLRRDGRIGIGDVSWIVEHVLLGLQAAHEAGVVHRDVKPGNIFLEQVLPPRARVLDFGVAKRFRGSEAVTSGLAHSTGLTKIGDVLGTPSYMSPEQLDNARDIDARTDIYSVGMVAYRMLAGRLPFELRDVATIREMKRTSALPPLAHATGVTWPDAVEGWVQGAAATRPEERFGSAHAALAAWRTACESMRSHIAVPASAPSRPADTDIAPESR